VVPFSFVLFVLLTIIGLLNWIVRPHGGGRQEVFLIGTRQLLMDVHVWLAVMFMVTIVIHLVLHWYYIKAYLSQSGL
jgi:hypothetical protein